MENFSKVTRRQFFHKALSFTVQQATDVLSASVQKIAPHIFIRPPGALPEAEFLFACTRCGDCAAACPHSAIDLLSVKQGGAFNSPAITPSIQPCLMCEDFPCIQSCLPKALTFPKDSSVVKIGFVKIDEKKCWSALGQECDYCEKECRRYVGAIHLKPGFPPEINTDLCDGCGRCEYICPVSVKAAITVIPREG